MGRSELWKIRIAGSLLLGFLVSCFAAADEFRYLFWGRSARGDVVRAYDFTDTTTRGRSVPKLIVEYTFREEGDGGETRTEKDRVSAGSAVAAGQSVEIQYTPGPNGSSRLAGNRNTPALIFFFGFLAAGAAFFGKLYLEARAAYDDPRGRKKRRAR